ncbi:uncharacterized protein LOC8286417 isoform X2 [Ricinus communis]|uniref:uncharacterized protein LOC8286417 isoform X2 n=1 Tax=Ricinus communis TaxID=3988 RepID=UPI0007723608|nr:uncharacterized protein LOC8286417 isoform X2 [Ricinus communis]|eukprot:XP_015578280.1 uncharacterized protein LOC8286417 isoform X2 [Ricinus communis]
MGKNQAYKAMQRARLGSSSAGPEEVEDGMVDGSFHTPAWHAARLASLNTSHTVTWEEFKRKQKEDEIRKGELEADTDRMMREYRAQLDAERARKLAHGRNHSSSKSNHKKERRKIQRSVAAERESIQGADLRIRARQVHHQILQVATTRKGNQEDQSQDLREQRRKRSTGQDPSTLAMTRKRRMALCRSQDSSEV